MFSELPLAVFTTLAPIGAGAFMVLAFAVAGGKIDDAHAKAIDKLMLVPIVFVLIGLIASTIHLADPSHMMYALAGIGRSPLTNEICAASAFLVFAVVYWLACGLGNPSKSFRGTLAIITGFLGAVLAIFTGLAYMIPTIASWSTPLNVVQMLGFALVGGAALIALFGAMKGQDQLTALLKVLAAVGVVLAIIGVAGQLVFTNGLETAVLSGAGLVAEALPAAVVGLVLLVVACALTIKTAASKNAVYGWIAVVVAVCGVFALRFAFYALEMSVGMSL